MRSACAKRLRRCDGSNAARGLQRCWSLFCASNSLRSSTNCASWRAVCSNIYEPRIAVRRWERVGGGAARASDFIEARFIDATRFIVFETAAQKAEQSHERPSDGLHERRFMADRTISMNGLRSCLWNHQRQLSGGRYERVLPAICCLSPRQLERPLSTAHRPSRRFSKVLRGVRGKPLCEFSRVSKTPLKLDRRCCSTL